MAAVSVKTVNLEVGISGVPCVTIIESAGAGSLSNYASLQGKFTGMGSLGHVGVTLDP